MFKPARAIRAHLIVVLAGMAIVPWLADTRAWSQDAPAAKTPRVPYRRPSDQEGVVWPPKTIMQIDVDPRDLSDRKPPDRSGELIRSASASNWYNTPMPYQTASWVAPNIYYQPLYFEDVRLERYGQQPLGFLDPGRSGALFFADMFAFPWNALHARPRSYDYPLGLARPGADVPAVQNNILYRK